MSAEHDLNSFDTSSLRSHFTIEYNKGVYKLSLRGWDELPHFSVAYYNEKKKVLQMSAMSEPGFDALASQLKASGYQVPNEAHVRVSPTMPTTAEKILRKKIRLTPYESLFEVKPSPGARADIDKLNKVLAMILPEDNAGRDPDIDMLAKKAGIDLQLVRNVVNNAIQRIKELKGKK